MPSFVIAGGGLAAAKAAETLRDEGFDGEIVLLGAEPERPYERPPLSKGYLLGSDERDSIYVHPADWYAQHGVDLRPGVTVTAIDRAAATVTASGPAGPESVPYDKLLLATGASPRRLSFPGADSGDVLYLRTVADSDRLRSAFSPGTRVVIAGAGWIGLETAAAARAAGCPVTVLEPQHGALHDQLGPELGAVFAGLHQAHGVEFRFGEHAAEFRPGLVITSGGADLGADVLVVGIGAAPNDALAADAGLEVSNGVLTDAALRTSDLNIFAAGDVANSFHPAPRRRAPPPRPDHLRGGRRRNLVPPAAGPPGPRRALGQRAERRPGRRPVHARPARRVRPGALLLQRPVRPRHGMRGPALSRLLRSGRLPRRPEGAGVHRVLAAPRRRDRRHERQRLGRHRRHPVPHPLRPPSRPPPPTPPPPAPYPRRPPPRTPAPPKPPPRPQSPNARNYRLVAELYQHLKKNYDDR